jgi:hypothetical protein
MNSTQILTLPIELIRIILQFVVHPNAFLIKNINYNKEYNKLVLKQIRYNNSYNFINVFGLFNHFEKRFYSSLICRNNWFKLPYNFYFELKNNMLKADICKYLNNNKIKFNKSLRKRELIKLALSF